ncbi:MAG: aldolase catalytic domain-containing protein [Bacteroidales bacterium]|nr:aldolase catalytic domain-containing protein [Bacteroidales bacterium]
MNFKILDCTLRDGGYYTDWDFNDALVSQYLTAMNKLPVDYLELGYRNNPSAEYLGKFGYTPKHILEKIRQFSNKKLAVMLNEKSTTIADLQTLVVPIKGLVDMIRIAVDPKNFDRAVELAGAIRKEGFEVSFNMMYMSKWKTYDGLFDKLPKLNGSVDILVMVDSFGGIFPDDVKETINSLRDRVSCKIGFHGHNNLQMSLINTITAINNGVDSVDGTILGMGRGAGNLNMEMLLTYLNKEGLKLDFGALSDAITTFSPLYEKYRWGTQLPYMISGANSLPQKEVMALVQNRAYSFESIVRGLSNRKDNVEDNAKFPIFDEPMVDDVLIIGGGQSPVDHIDSIRIFISQHKSIALVFATARHASQYHDIIAPKYFCLIGREAKRLTSQVGHHIFKDKCVLPPYPRKLGTEVPSFAKHKTYELSAITFTENYLDSCTTLAIQTALTLAKKNIYIVGYDGYSSSVLSEKEISLTNENMTLFRDFHKNIGKELVSLTPSLYPEIQVRSIYQYI